MGLDFAVLIILIILAAYLFIMEKICFKCSRLLPISEYYKHPKMGDGHLGKCKDCTKSDVKKDYVRKVVDPTWKEKERSRGREKHHRLYEGRAKGKPEINSKRNKNYIEKYPEKAITRKLNCNRLVAEGLEAHHWSYNVEHHKDVIGLSKKDHMKAHRFLIYDQERFMYRRYDTNELLDSKLHHLAFINWCLETKQD